MKNGEHAKTAQWRHICQDQANHENKKKNDAHCYYIQGTKSITP
jgi:hypothetical protein